jgi:hypothetical protein
MLSFLLSQCKRRSKPKFCRLRISGIVAYTVTTFWKNAFLGFFRYAK